MCVCIYVVQVFMQLKVGKEVAGLVAAGKIRQKFRMPLAFESFI